MGKASRDKGQRWEHEVRRRFEAIYPGRTITRGWQAAAGGNAPDVDGTDLWIECKAGKRVNPRAALDQAQKDTDGRPCLAVIHDDSPGGGKPAREWVAMSWNDFVRVFTPSTGEQGAEDAAAHAAIAARLSKEE